MDTFPGIMLRDGPAGQRPGLIGGPDVWEIARVIKGLGPDDASREQVAELTGLEVEQVDIVADYYAEHREEIDAWIRRVDEEADEAEAAWRQEQGFPR